MTYLFQARCREQAAEQVAACPSCAAPPSTQRIVITWMTCPCQARCQEQATEQVAAFLRRSAAIHSEHCDYMGELCQGSSAVNRQELDKVRGLIRASASSITGRYPQEIPICEALGYGCYAPSRRCMDCHHSDCHGLPSQ